MGMKLHLYTCLSSHFATACPVCQFLLPYTQSYISKKKEDSAQNAKLCSSHVVDSLTAQPDTEPSQPGDDPSGDLGRPCLKCAKVLLWYMEHIGAISIVQDYLTCKS